ncbi:uncharacterized protein LOC141910910 [Tubulanus polymorphus]|uniref:uncharacterized protein LOC141910910 n=1 Tax=Tubulanus polymorphus TaxID=672921 RepID=UPI003DA42093
MAPKKGKKGKKKGGKKKKMKGMLQNPDILVKRLMKTYEMNCRNTNTLLCMGVKKLMKACIEKNQLLVKLVIEPVPVETKDDLQVKLEPLIAAVRSERYTYIKDIYVWDLFLEHSNIATLSLMLEKGFYQVRVVELIDCLIQPYGATRLARTFNYCHTLTTLCLDYNEFSDEGCQGLCEGLVGNKTLLSLSLNYCDLGKASGKMLGKMVTTTALQELYLDGNNLRCEGTIELIKVLAERAEQDYYQKIEDENRKLEEEQKLLEAEKEARLNPTLGTTRIGSEKSDVSNKSSSKKGKKGKGKKGKKKGKSKKKKKEVIPPLVGPWLHKLHIADNGIDSYGEVAFAPVIAMRLFRQWITFSDCLQEIDLDKNLIGNLGGREILEGIKTRKEAKLKSIGIRVTHRMTEDLFTDINKSGSGVKKKKGKKGKGKKKKK